MMAAVTPDQLHNNLLLLAGTGGALLVDTAAWRRLPALAAAAAFVPLFTRRLPLGPLSRAALTPPDATASYRAAPTGPVDWSRLPGARRFELRGASFALDPSRARLVARLPFAPSWFAFGGVASLRLRVDGDAVVVTARALPWLSLTSAGFFGALLALVGPHGPRAIGALFLALLALFNAAAALRTRRRYGPIAAAGADELARRVAR
jgi:hypothetical protein